MANVQITIRDHGPYIVQGGVKLTDSSGTPVERREVLALCRCGHSNTKPFCDGTHNAVGFESAPRAAAKE